MLATTTEQLAEKQRDLSLLTITAPMDGYVFPATRRPSVEPGDGRLPQWSGSPFDKKNVGALLNGADQFCQIGNSTSFEAVLVIDQADVNLVHGYFNKYKKYPPVVLKFDAYRWKTVDGEIEKLASAPMEDTPASLSIQGGGELETKTDKKTGTLKTISTSYQASVPLDDDQELLRVGLKGKAKVYTGWQSLYERTYRYIARTFHFDW
jgi:putative peptide zinc metalloprotease protein